jgi:hypothetical protein
MIVELAMGINCEKNMLDGHQLEDSIGGCIGMSRGKECVDCTRFGVLQRLFYNICASMPGRDMNEIQFRACIHDVITTGYLPDTACYPPSRMKVFEDAGLTGYINADLFKQQKTYLKMHTQER